LFSPRCTRRGPAPYVSYARWSSCDGGWLSVVEIARHCLRGAHRQRRRGASAQRTVAAGSVAAGSWGGRRLSLADYVMGTGAPRGRPLPEGASVDYPLAPGAWCDGGRTSQACRWSSRDLESRHALLAASRPARHSRRRHRRTQPRRARRRLRRHLQSAHLTSASAALPAMPPAGRQRALRADQVRARLPAPRQDPGGGGEAQHAAVESCPGLRRVHRGAPALRRRGCHDRALGPRRRTGG
jgi:hypothetical protein